jgi:hypothetical protein
MICCFQKSYASKTIEVHQVIFNATNAKQNITLKSIYNTSRDIPQDFVVYNVTTIYVMKSIN